MNLTEELKRVLPPDHPFIKTFEQQVKDPTDTLQSLIEVVDDWKRGIRDWNEVERKLDDVKHEVSA